MERFLIFNTHTAQSIYYKELSGNQDRQKLAFESYSLLQTSNFSLKALEGESLYCFGYQEEVAVAVVCVFSIGQEYSQSMEMCQNILRIFIEELGEMIGKKIMPSQLKMFKSKLRNMFLETLKFKLEAISVSFNLRVIYLLKMDSNGNLQASAENPILLSLSGSLQSGLSSAEKLKFNSKFFKKKILGNAQNQSSGKILLKFGDDILAEDKLETILNLFSQGSTISEIQSDTLNYIVLTIMDLTFKVIKKQEIAIVFCSEHELDEDSLETIYKLGRLLI